MTPRQLELFASVAAQGSFSKAAAALGLTQPALSRHVRLLEDELRVELFYRNGRGVRLTEVGRRFLGEAEDVLARLAQLKDGIVNPHGTPLKKAVIALPPTVAGVLTSPLSKALLEAFPALELHLLEALTNQICDLVESSAVDIGIAYQDRPIRQLSCEPLVEERVYLVGTGGKAVNQRPIRVQDLADLPMVLPSKSHGLRLLVDELAHANGFEMRVKVEADMLATIRQLMLDGIGYSILPLAAVRHEVCAGLMQASPLIEPEVRRTVVIATALNRAAVPGLRPLVEIIKREVGQVIAGEIGQAADWGGCCRSA